MRLIIFFLIEIATVGVAIAQELPTPKPFQPISSKSYTRILGKFSARAWKQALTANDVAKVDSFSPRDVVSHHEYEFDRTDEFRRFLQDYNLIGMSHNEVIRLLGTEDASAGYSIFSGGGDVSCSLYLAYDREKVQKWCLRTGLKQADWITQNVYYTPVGETGADGQRHRFIPKISVKDCRLTK